MVWTPQNAKQWVLDRTVNPADYESELVDGLPVLKSLQTAGDLRQPRGKACYDFDGVDDHILIPGLLGTEAVTNDGTAVLTPTAGRIDATAGTCWNIRIDDGAFAVYYCNEESGLTCFDSSGNGNHGTLTGIDEGTFHAVDDSVSANPANEVGYTEGSGFTDDVASGASGQSCRFDGSDDYVDLGTIAAFDGCTTGSVSAWVKFSTLAGVAQAIVARDTPDAFNYFQFSLQSSGKLIGFLATGGGNQWKLETDAIVFATNTWYHVAVVQNATEPVLYVNGLAPTQSFTISADKTKWWDDFTDTQEYVIGRNNVDGPTYNLDGRIDDVRVYDDALTADEITYLYEEHTGTPSVPGDDPGTTNLKAHWTFDGDYLDTSGNGNHGTPVGIDGTPIIPRDESAPTKDVLGGDLQYAGVCPYPIAVNTPVANFDGVNDYVSVLSVPELSMSITDAFELEADVKTSDTNDARGIIAKYADIPLGYGYFMALLGGKLYAQINSENQSYIYRVGSTIVNDNQWHHVRCTLDGTATAEGIHLYVDGVEETYSDTQTSGTLDNVENSDPLRIGARKSTEPLSAEIINAKVVKNASLSGQWTCSEGNGLDIYDVSVNGNHGTAEGITESTFWQEQTNQAKDHAIEYGGTYRRNLVPHTEDLTPTGDNENGWVVNATVTPGQPDPDGGNLAIRLNPLSTDSSVEIFKISRTDGNTMDSILWARSVDGPISNVRMLTNADGIDLTTSWQKFTVSGTGGSAGTTRIIWLGGWSSFSSANGPIEIYQPALFQQAETDQSFQTITNNRSALVSHFVPGLLDGTAAADGNPLTLTPGNHSNPKADLLFDAWSAPELAPLNLPAASPPGELLREVAPENTKFRSEDGATAADWGTFIKTETDYIDLNHLALKVTGDYTVCFRAFHDPSLSVNSAVIGCWGASIGWMVYADGSGSAIYRDGANFRITNLWVANEWHHYSFVAIGGDGRQFRDGVLVDSGAIGSISQSQSSVVPQMGTYQDGSGLYLQSLVGELRLYDRAKTDQEIADIAGGVDDRDGLLGYWDFSDQASTTLTDQSGNGNDGTVNADPATFWGSGYLPGTAFADGDNRVFTNADTLTGTDLDDAMVYVSRAVVTNPPVNTVPPLVTGSPQPNLVLSCDTGTWTESPTGYTYQWYTATDIGRNWGVFTAANSEWVSIGDQAALRRTDTFTVRCRVRFTDLVGNVGFYSTQFFNGGSPLDGLTLWRSSSVIRVWLGNGSAIEQIDSNALVSADTWYDVTYTYDNGVGLLYVDEVKQTAETANSLTYLANTPTAIGAGSGDGVYNFNGSIEDVQYHSTALTQQEITDGNTDNLVARWDFSDQGGTDLTDIIGGLNGTLTNVSDLNAFWQNNGGAVGTPIADETSSTYTVADTDPGKYLYCVVTASNDGGSANEESNRLMAYLGVPINTVIPSLTITPAVV